MILQYFLRVTFFDLFNILAARKLLKKKKIFFRVHQLKRNVAEIPIGTANFIKIIFFSTLETREQNFQQTDQK